ncbi:MAG TPA: hypothetical protein VLW55_02600 [Burkholderiaceae bacterium]|nr:hypothetical protein [Burkholderiaceae bacterium]
MNRFHIATRRTQTLPVSSKAQRWALYGLVLLVAAVLMLLPLLARGIAG